MSTRLDTPRLLLRRWQDSDLDRYSKLCADPEVMRWIGNGAVRTSEECAHAIERFEAAWEADGFGLFAVELKTNHQFIGFCGLSVPHFLPEVLPTVEIGWRFDRTHWGKGLATEAAQSCMGFGFRTVGLAEIVSICQVGNTASERIMQKIGMTFDRKTVDPTCSRAVHVYRKSTDRSC